MIILIYLILPGKKVKKPEYKIPPHFQWSDQLLSFEWLEQKYLSYSDGWIQSLVTCALSYRKEELEDLILSRFTPRSKKCKTHIFGKIFVENNFIKSFSDHYKRGRYVFRCVFSFFFRKNRYHN